MLLGSVLTVNSELRVAQRAEGEFRNPTSQNKHFEATLQSFFFLMLKRNFTDPIVLSSCSDNSSSSTQKSRNSYALGASARKLGYTKTNRKKCIWAEPPKIKHFTEQGQTRFIHASGIATTIRP